MSIDKPAGRESDDNLGELKLCRLLGTEIDDRFDCDASEVFLSAEDSIDSLRGRINLNAL
jgi:hypothetical protein